MQIDWDLVKQALEVRQINEKAAEYLLMQALGEADLTVEVSEQEVDEVQVDYGVNGYTDEYDPRADSANHNSLGADKRPETVHTLVLTNPQTPYYCSRVEAYGPKTQQGGGRTLILVEQPDSSEIVVLGTGAEKSRGKYDDWILHNPGQDVVIAGGGVKFSPPNLGPASVFLSDGLGTILSDEVRSMGLPAGEHFVYRVEFRRGPATSEGRLEKESAQCKSMRAVLGVLFLPHWAQLPLSSPPVLPALEGIVLLVALAIYLVGTVAMTIAVILAVIEVWRRNEDL